MYNLSDNYISSNKSCTNWLYKFKPRYNCACHFSATCERAVSWHHRFSRPRFERESGGTNVISVRPLIPRRCGKLPNNDQPGRLTVCAVHLGGLGRHRKDVVDGMKSERRVHSGTCHLASLVARDLVAGHRRRPSVDVETAPLPLIARPVGGRHEVSVHAYRAWSPGVEMAPAPTSTEIRRLRAARCELSSRWQREAILGYRPDGRAGERVRAGRQVNTADHWQWSLDSADHWISSTRIQIRQLRRQVTGMPSSGR